MRVGLVCPYSFDVAGGVQFHVRDLAEWLGAHGHHASVIAPADEDAHLPDYFTSCGRAVPVRYNGSVARLTFGPVTAARVNRWLDAGNFDVVHIHEPMTPSASVLALRAFDGPIVATFHTSTLRSRAMSAAYPLLRPSLEKINGRIAVSEEARRTVIRHIGGDAVVIPNGVDVGVFAKARVTPQWCGRPDAPTVGFLGRLDEPRKGLRVLAQAMDPVLHAIPQARLLVAGPGDADEARAEMTPAVAAATEFLGALSNADKASFLHSIDLYVAPNTGGESFGIILVEAMAAGAPVLASDLPAFLRVLGDEAGASFANENTTALAGQIVRLLGDDAERVRLPTSTGRSSPRTSLRSMTR
ncbi:GDP-mannose-dependent alpha-(1-2)-phosphatidylinositol mannosyltransferase [Nostocoides australiense Ben110]|uniref:D-inositol 3-phosphate glycosyltransferase n=1 Tax=Nostocoides australiense Ben110 TaxID=1193182 RepID=W6K4B2_9MICO|nr:GDP-mannose-dependent alpha-(1-2)-phosphatidylinositol mannosyltransferase [Tetrasphaera australiensis Ben110]